MSNQDYDVAIIGAGASGICAAIQCARMKCRTVLIEKNGMCGGTTTVAGVNYPGLFDAWGRQIIAGIGWELVKDTLSLMDEKLPDFKEQHRQIRINPLFFALLAEEALLKNDVEIKYHTMTAEIKRNPNSRSWKMTLCGKDGLYDLQTKFMIDCTGDANAVKLAGYPVTEPAECQPGTMCIDINNYDPEKVDLKEIKKAFEKARLNGEVIDTDCGWGKNFHESYLSGRGWNNNHIGGINAASSEGKTKLEISGHSSVLRMIRFLKHQKGLENLQFGIKGLECGVRETRVIVGEKTVTAEEYITGYECPDALCFSFYPIDLHCTGNGILHQDLKYGAVPSVPRGAMIPVGADSILAAGRIISSDRLANSALRVQATCMATGQAAGAMAALSCINGISPMKLSVSDIRMNLKTNGAIVPGKQ